MTSYNVVVKLERNSSVPLYAQMVNSMEQKIKNSIYAPGEQIPTELELGEIYGVSRIVVRKAIGILEKNGLIEIRRGKGTFVSMPKVVEEFESSGSFTKSMIKAGAKPKTKALSVDTVQFDDLIYYVKDYADGDQLIEIKRLRLINERPVILELDYFKPSFNFIRTADVENFPIMEVLRKELDVVAHHFEDIVDIVFSDEEIANYLNLEVGEPVLKVEQKVLTIDNELIYFNVQYIKSREYQYAVRYGG